ncbi:hypothetical protein BABINDRAFT_162759 [Babjeviella inositovora NRRL Y-12698]|uniref:Amino acid permease/ SLC12A domain-containing protein n=1 Tax=Babjeviella inositovora NRRL Y-12698 TaxID=984486 RepID=A0A1E3QLJ0_9ASCO|nr:uncharacterized protein BABINDRAFT_162759 [Babjeviella inositovora NRRL Y-12698]ODQ78553.1 hypothetical protein BABINDRAFT_162759 [Babjeviella inositovora NRRL Y-12698]
MPPLVKQDLGQLTAISSGTPLPKHDKYIAHDGPDDMQSFTGETAKIGGWQGFVDSFKQYKTEEISYDPNVSDLERAAIKNANSPLSRKLKGRHLQMIAIGSSIGTGLFVGSGSALHTGGPGGVLIAWFLIGIMMYSTVQGLGELAVAFPVSGGFNTYATRFIDPSIGFAVGWNYFLQFVTLMPLELVAASITIQYWNTTINPDVWVCIFYVVVITINFFGVKGYGEAEFVFSTIKVIAVIGFIILGIVLAAGGAPNGFSPGTQYWHVPGAFANGFKGVASTFITAAFSFGGTELIGLTAAETLNPRKMLPAAIKQVFWRITLFYFVSLTIITFLVPYNNLHLMGASSVDVTASPFVIAIEQGGISGLSSVMNAVILISVLSVGSSSVYATSRTLVGLAELGQAPKICGYIDRAGRPLVAIILTNVFGLLAFIAASGKQNEVFSWLLAISGLSSLFTWITINWAHLRFRRALKVQGRSTSELTFVSQAGIVGSLFGFGLVILVLVAQFWIALFPLGGPSSAENFFASYLGFLILLSCYFGHKLYTRNWKLQHRARDIDIDTGRKVEDIELLKQEIAVEKAAMSQRPVYYRWYKFWC